jgi:2'-5' RNA ligase
MKNTMICSLNIFEEGRKSLEIHKNIITKLSEYSNIHGTLKELYTIDRDTLGSVIQLLTHIKNYVDAIKKQKDMINHTPSTIEKEE